MRPGPGPRRGRRRCKTTSTGSGDINLAPRIAGLPNEENRHIAKLEIAEGGGTREPTFGNRRSVYADQSNMRPEARLEDPAHANRPELTSTD